MDTAQQIGHGLRVARTRARRTTEEAATHLDVSTATILRWERGVVAMPAPELFKLASFYETTVDGIGKDGGVSVPQG
jgi:DNA-binding XRE family transcriptional regulator